MTDNAENSSEARKPVLPPDNRVSLPREWPFRLLGNALILALVFLTAFLTVTVRTNLVGRQIDSLTEEFYVLTSKLGFTLDDILIEGRKKTSRRAVMEVLGLKRGDNILSLDLNELKNRIETLPWVRRADIRRSYFPNIQHISLVYINSDYPFPYPYELVRLCGLKTTKDNSLTPFPRNFRSSATRHSPPIVPQESSYTRSYREQTPSPPCKNGHE